MQGRKERVVAYIDGFNLYFGLKESGFQNCKWLDLRKLISGILKSNQELKEIHYFTSRQNNGISKQKNQSIYIEALESKDINIIYGQFQESLFECHHCGRTWNLYKEKLTDVNIASNMILDAYEDKYDTAILISGDSDLTPPIIKIHEKFKAKKVIVIFPPKRNNQSLSNCAKGSFTLGRKKLVDAQFEPLVLSKNGYWLCKPDHW